jgi:putative ABC transport system permease protein
VTGAASVGATQPSLRLPASLVSARGRVEVALEGVADVRPLWHPTLRRGALPAAGPGLVVAEGAAERLGVSVGDRVRVLHPVPSGPSSYRLESTSLPVTGVHTSPLRFVAYASAAAAPGLRLAGLVNRISVAPAPGRTADDVKAELLRMPGVTAVQGAAATTDAVDGRMAQFDDILAVTVAIAAAMALLIAFNAMAISADERTREHATMFAHGVTVARVLRGGVAEALVIGLLGTAAGLGAGHALLAWIVRTNLSATMPDVGVLTTVGGATYAVALAAGTVVVAAAPLLTLRRLRRTDLPGALRVVE